MQEGILETALAGGQVMAWCGEGLWPHNALDRFPEEKAQLSPEGHRGDNRGSEDWCRLLGLWQLCRNPCVTGVLAGGGGNGCLLSGASIMLDLCSFILSSRHLPLLPRPGTLV